jgi:hypothetical protein
VVSSICFSRRYWIVERVGVRHSRRVVSLRRASLVVADVLPVLFLCRARTPYVVAYRLPTVHGIRPGSSLALGSTIVVPRIRAARDLAGAPRRILVHTAPIFKVSPATFAFFRTAVVPPLRVVRLGGNAFFFRGSDANHASDTTFDASFVLYRCIPSCIRVNRQLPEGPRRGFS